MFKTKNRKKKTTAVISIRKIWIQNDTLFLRESEDLPTYLFPLVYGQGAHVVETSPSFSSVKQREEEPTFLNSKTMKTNFS